jgi:hypothetical protein
MRRFSGEASKEGPGTNKFELSGRHSSVMNLAMLHGMGVGL